MIKFFKLMNGEEIVAEVEDSEEWCERLALRQPYRNVMTKDGMMLVPYPCETVQLGVHNVLFSGDACPDLVNAYCQSTGKIVTATRGIQLP